MTDLTLRHSGGHSHTLRDPAFRRQTFRQISLVYGLKAMFPRSADSAGLSVALGFAASTALILAACDSTIPVESQSRPQPRAPVTELLEPMASDQSQFAASDAIRSRKVLPGRHEADPLPARPSVSSEKYADSKPSPILRVSDEPVSTFSIDVDTGSYSNIRRMLNHGKLPSSDAVRVEELINYFDYAYARPVDAAFSVSTAMAPAPWNDAAHLLRIGINGRDVASDEAYSANLVFLVDVSGSMSSPDKLGLLTSSLSLLVQGLDEDDRVSIVTYAGSAGVVLDSAAGNDHAAIESALANLRAGGSTAGEAGIKVAYQLAQKNRRDNSVNRVILATDGDFNVGVSSVDALLELIEQQRDTGVALTTLGFGSGNYNDHLMEQLADAGNGNHAYIDTLGEARKVLSEQLDATLFTIASDVKVQVEFNPAVVAEYRLIGYDNRQLNEEDFNNDKVDAGDIGAGHSVTALYEIVLVGTQGRLPTRRYEQEPPINTLSNELGELRLRYKDPETPNSASRLITSILEADEIVSSFNDADTDFRFAVSVAAWGELLRDDRYMGNFSYEDVLELARNSRGKDHFGYRAEFIGLLELSEGLDRRERLSRGAPVESENSAQRDRG